MQDPWVPAPEINLCGGLPRAAMRHNTGAVPLMLCSCAQCLLHVGIRCALYTVVLDNPIPNLGGWMAKMQGT